MFREAVSVNTLISERKEMIDLLVKSIADLEASPDFRTVQQLDALVEEMEKIINEMNSLKGEEKPF